jgi:hypothetical protein
MTQLEQKLTDLENRINAVPAELRVIMTARLGLESAREKIESEAVKGVLWQSEAHNSFPQLDGPTCANTLTTWLVRGSGQEVHALAALDAAQGALERHPKYAEAVGVLEPLLRERDALRAAIAAEAKRLDAAREAAAEALRMAKERALAAAESDAEVAAAQAALASLEAPPPAPAARFRGKVAVGTAE